MPKHRRRSLVENSRLTDSRIQVCQVFSQKNLTIWRRWDRVKEMPKAAKTRSTASSIRLQIERGGEKLWRHNDFRDEPFAAVAQALSRLTRNGTLQRLSKGIYYRPRTTAL